MAKEFPLAVVIRAVDKITAPLNRINRKLNAFNAPFRKLSASASAFSKAFGFPALIDGFSRVGSSIGRLGSAVASVGLRIAALTAGATYALVSFSRKIIDSGDSLNDLRNQTGLSAQTIGELQYALGQSGVSSEETGNALRKMTVALGQAKQGTGNLAGYLEKTNPALLRQVNAAGSAEEKLNILTAALDKTKDAQSRAALGAAIYGRGVGIKMAAAIKDGSQSMEEMRAQFRAANPDMDEFATRSDDANDAIGRFDMTMKGLQNTAANSLLPALTPLLDALRVLLLEYKKPLEEWAKNFAKNLPANLEKLKAKFAELKESVKAILAPIRWLTDRFGTFNTIAAALGLVILGPVIAATFSLAAAMISLGIAMTPVLIKLGALIIVPIISFLSSVVIGLKVATSAMQFFNLMLMANPIGLVVAGIALLIGAGYLLWKHWKTIIGGFGALWDNMKSAVSGVGEFILGIFERVGEYVNGIFKGIGDTLKWIGRQIGVVSEEANGAADGMQGRANALGANRPTLGAAGAAPAPSNGVARSQAEVNVNFSNVPKGVRVTQDPRSTANVNTNLGYTMADAAGAGF